MSQEREREREMNAPNVSFVLPFISFALQIVFYRGIVADAHARSEKAEQRIGLHLYLSTALFLSYSERGPGQKN